jgi:hypothetical protein
MLIELCPFLDLPCALLDLEAAIRRVIADPVITGSYEPLRTP